MTRAIVPGQPHPLGASHQADGVNFAVYSPDARSVQLCLFDEQDREERLTLPACQEGIWHGRVPGLPAGQRYGFRADGDYRPDQGLLFNPAKLLLDPYAQALSAAVEPHPGLYQAGDDSDTAALLPKALTPGPDDFDWQGSVQPATPWPDSLIYELHIRGFSRLNPAVPAPLRGTYLGLAHPASLAHLTTLGVTAVQLMPCFSFMTERRLVELGLSNYWGYNPVGCFAPDPRYAVEDAVSEFKTMVRALHQAGIEVILDVVYNHSAEADAEGPTLNLKGLANRQYYRHPKQAPGEYEDYSGCHNTLDIGQPAALRLVMDSLRHWRRHYRVDGFRFDLAVVLGRDEGPFSAHAAFFKTLQQDPTLAGCKLIAEPWDLGPDGYQASRFPPGWYESDDRYRDGLRRFWRGDEADLADLLTPDRARLNLISYHDGFTLADLVSYAERHNEGNGEDNRDGHTQNFSCNWGAEGPSDDPQIQALRRRARRNLITTLLLTPGPAHWLGGDEIGRSQDGNNNAYCQDNELSWFDWAAADNDLFEFVRRCIALRRRARIRSLTGHSREALRLEGETRLQLLINATDQPAERPLDASQWQWLLDTASGENDQAGAGPGRYRLAPWSMAVFEQR